MCCAVLCSAALCGFVVALCGFVFVFGFVQAADWLTSQMLDEQHRGVRELAGHITQLTKMGHHQPHLAEFMFDLELAKRH